MKKLDLNKAITWGGYIKLCVACFIALMAIWGAWIAYLLDIPQKIKAKIKSIFKKDKKED